MLLSIFLNTSHLDTLFCEVAFAGLFLPVTKLLKYDCFIMTLYLATLLDSFIRAVCRHLLGFSIFVLSAHSDFHLFVVLLHFLSCVTAQVGMPAQC